MYGGSTTSILMRIPGEAASVMTCIDGYEMTRKGRAGPALAIAAVGSYIAGTISVVGLMLLAPPLASFALRFGPPEYFALLLLGLLVLAYMSGGSMLKSLAMATLGLLLGMIGIDPMTGFFRFSYGLVELGDGIGVVPVAVGLFGLSEILLTAGQPTPPEVRKPRLKELLPSREEWRDSLWPIGRGTVLGFLIGIIPGSAHIISSFVSYAMERRLSKHPERFGHGAIEGVAGPESANNSATSGAFVPMLALGVPSGPIPAVMIAAMMVHGISPGPLLITQQPELFWGFIASMYVENVVLLILNGAEEDRIFQIHQNWNTTAPGAKQFELGSRRAINRVVGGAQVFAKQFGFRREVSLFRMGREHPILDVHAGVEAQLIDLAQDHCMV